MKVYIFNTSIITGGPGNYILKTSGVQEFREIWKKATEKVSAIGHEATAQIFSIILDEKVSVNRIQAEQKPGEIGLVLKIKGRIPEGTVLTDMNQIQEIGYELFKLERKDIYSLNNSLAIIGHELGGALRDIGNGISPKQGIEKAWKWIQELQRELKEN
jgi:hypothetical protein